MPKLNPELYGGDPISVEPIAARILGVPDPTLDINGETDGRAVSEGNHGCQGGGKSSQGEPANISRGGKPSTDGGT